MTGSARTYDWPSLVTDESTATRETLHMWTQIVGKLRMAHMPLVNHWWQVTLYVSARGLTTGAIPYRDVVFDMEFDFVNQNLAIRKSDGDQETVALAAKPVAEFYGETLSALDRLGIEQEIHGQPNEVDPAIPFAEDYQHCDYEPDSARTFWRQLVQAHRVTTDFRAAYIGKASPVQFFWGAMDLACTRFSGRAAPLHPGGAPNCPDWVMAEGYSRELSSCGFWPGGGREGAFYSYAYPEPDGFSASRVEPSTAYFSRELGEFVLPYEAVRTSDDPDRAVAQFLQSSYEAAANLGGWDRSLLEDDSYRLSPRPIRDS
jgi:hypothetical protein